ncbi:hypothetical protein [Caulobacter sp. S45]|uniref:hypothetical protein n=1 Tax=Caulobacter sp. S45 TaxID=1641861 RepID=UPI001576F8A0|nr:hypothetical protein [Caulobacter sp. S45]
MPSSHRATMMMLSLLAAAGALPASARPASPTANPAAVAQAIGDCRKLTDRDARLDCYDKATDAFEQAQASGQVVVVDREQVRAVKRQAFGFNVPSLNLFAHGPKEEQVDKVSVKLAGAHQNGDSRWVMVTDEDAVWTQIDGADLFNPPHAGSTVAIRKAMLGSYFCNVDGQSAIRCIRTR